MTNPIPLPVSCDTARIELSTFLDGEDTPGTEERLDAVEHLSSCAACATFFRQARHLGRLAIGTTEAGMFDELTERRLWRGIAASARRSGVKTPTRRWAERAAAGLMLALTGAGLWWGAMNFTISSPRETQRGDHWVSEASTLEGGSTTESQRRADRDASAAQTPSSVAASEVRR